MHVRTVAKSIYEILKLGWVFYEVNLFLKTDKPHLLEINTIPGLTKRKYLTTTSAQAGISLPDLFDNAIQEALQKNS